MTMNPTIEQQQACRHFMALDAEWKTEPSSPLHHDNRCPIQHNATPKDKALHALRVKLLGDRFQKPASS